MSPYRARARRGSRHNGRVTTRFALSSSLLLSLVGALGCDGAPPVVIPPGVERAWVSAPIAGCTYASPTVVRSRGEDFVLAVGQTGEVTALDPDDGTVAWSVRLEPDNDFEVIELLSTPAVAGGRYLVLAWQERDAAMIRVRHRVAAVDLETRALAPELPPITLSASVPTFAGDGNVTFDSRWQLQRSMLLAVAQDDLELGLVYVPLGNGPSDQPFHGWVFELDVDAWRARGADAAVANVLVTTAENGCGPPGNRDPSVCGGGVWNAAGMLLDQPTPGGPFTLYVPTGNGRQDLDVGAYAHSVMRTTRGLAFDPGCDAALCADFDELAPSSACQASCSSLFMARPAEGDAPLAPENGLCEGFTFLQCYGRLDADLGANAPVLVQPRNGPRVLVQPGKDGALYLVDPTHLGRMYQRLQIRDFCGTQADPCDADWAGTFVTQPAVSEVDGDPVVIVASLMLDRTHPSGISAYRVVMEGDEPRLVRHWDVPSFDSEEARTVFRNHPGRPVIARLGGDDVVFVVEVRRDGLAGNPPGYLWGVRVRDGELLVRVPITDAGQRYARPLVWNGHLYLSTCPADARTNGRIESFRLTP